MNVVNSADLHSVFGGRCYFCGNLVTTERDSPLFGTRDHFRPRSRGGADAVQNIVLGCQGCNNAKGAEYPADYIYSIMNGEDPREGMHAACLVEGWEHVTGRIKNNYPEQVERGCFFKIEFLAWNKKIYSWEWVYLNVRPEQVNPVRVPWGSSAPWDGAEY